MANFLKFFGVGVVIFAVNTHACKNYSNHVHVEKWLALGRACLPVLRTQAVSSVLSKICT